MQISDEDAKLIKSKCLSDLRQSITNYKDRLTDIDPRMWAYAQDVIRSDKDVHNEMEVLALHKFLRMLDTYPFNYIKVHHVYKSFEMLDFDGLNGRQHYPLTNLQCFMLAGVFGLMKSKEDMRRIVTDAIYYIPRKVAKTTMAAFYAFYFFMFEDYNSEIYCCANSSTQSSILFKMAKALIAQLDPKMRHIRQTATICEWKQGQPRAAKIEALTAGSRAKDGLFTQLCCADEYGSAAYVNEKSDMGQLVSVVEGAMAARREPLTLTTTTAGRIAAGPFKDKLVGMEQTLREEISVHLDGQPHPMQNDWQFALLFQPDQWERDEESCKNPDVWKKVNPHIGVTVQPEYYANEWKKMMLDEEKKKENLCKLFNVYQTGKTKDWIKPEQIQRLQIPHSIEECTAENGWRVFVGMDFSMGDDLHAMSYLAWRNTGERDEFFADMDAWQTTSSLNASSLKQLMHKWGESGHLHIVQGETLEPNVPIDRIVELYDKGITFMAFGYDPYKAKTPINALKAWIFSEGGDEKQMIIPVRQNFATYNPLVEEMDYMVKTEDPMIHFSSNPMWGWEFGNAVLQESNDGMGNVKPVKGSSRDAKVDNVQALLSALSLFDLFDGKQNNGDI